ncbi:MAG: hypothetical protein B6U89_04390, partial [Desulfurococcales archaeon ex4484_58]
MDNIETINDNINNEEDFLIKSLLKILAILDINHKKPIKAIMIDEKINMIDIVDILKNENNKPITNSIGKEILPINSNNEGERKT